MNYPLATTTWDNKEYSAMQRVIASGNFTMGEEVKTYEKAFSSCFNSNNAVMSNSGSSANLLAMSALRYSEFLPTAHKDEVIVPAVSWSTTFFPITQAGYKLKFIDIDLETLNVRFDQIREAIDARTAGVVVVNLLGNPAELSEIRDLCDEKKIFLMEDNCESMGAKYNDKFAGTFGHIGSFSSFFSHHISTMEGGMSITDSTELEQIMRSLRAHGWTRDLPDINFLHNKSGDDFDDSFRFVLPGYNVRPLELEGAIGQEQLKKLPGIISGRRDNARKFQNLMSNFPEILTQKEIGESSWFGFSMILEGRQEGRRAELVSMLRKRSIAVRPIVAGNFTKNPVLKHLPYVEFGNLPNADKVHVDGLFVGNHHYEMNEEFDLLESALAEFLRG